MRLSVWFPLLLAAAAPVAASLAAPVAAPGAIPVTTRSGPLASPRPAAARAAEPADPALLCETAIATAEYAGRLPARLLGAIGLTETGRAETGGRPRPWPWTINAEGEGRFFETKRQAVAAVKALQARGIRSIDVGCLQVNLMYHPEAFATMEDALDPRMNAVYAAGFLAALYAEGRDWAHAIAAYHSQTPALGDAYRVQVMARWQNSDLRPVAPPATAYGDFVRRDAAYGAFAPSNRAYGAFGVPAGGR